MKISCPMKVVGNLWVTFVNKHLNRRTKKLNFTEIFTVVNLAGIFCLVWPMKTFTHNSFTK